MTTVSVVSDFPPPRPSDLPGPSTPLRPVVGVATFLGRMYVAAGSLALLTAVALANRARTASNTEIDVAGDSAGVASVPLVDESLRNADIFVAMASGLFAVAALTVFVMLVTWTWRMDRNMRTLGRPPRLPGPLAIAGWLIPVANLVVPFVFVRDFVRGLTAVAPVRGAAVRAADYSVATFWWFGQFAVLFLSASVSGERTFVRLEQFADADRTTAIGFAFFAVSAACGAVTFRRFARDSFDSI